MLGGELRLDGPRSCGEAEPGPPARVVGGGRGGDAADRALEETEPGCPRLDLVGITRRAGSHARGDRRDELHAGLRLGLSDPSDPCRSVGLRELREQFGRLFDGEPARGGAAGGGTHEGLDPLPDIGERGGLRIPLPSGTELLHAELEDGDILSCRRFRKRRQERVSEIGPAGVGEDSGRRGQIEPRSLAAQLGAEGGSEIVPLGAGGERHAGDRPQLPAVGIADRGGKEAGQADHIGRREEGQLRLERQAHRARLRLRGRGELFEDPLDGGGRFGGLEGREKRRHAFPSPSEDIVAKALELGVERIGGGCGGRWSRRG